MRIREHLRIQLRQLINERHWLDLAELASLGCSAVGTVAATLLQQVAYAAAPVTLAVFLNFLNQKRPNLQETQDIPSLYAEIERRFSDLEQQLMNLPEPVEINLTEVYDELTKLNKSLPMIEGKAAFMTAKIYDKLSLQINSVRQQIADFSEPFDLTRVEAKIASLNVAVQFLAQRPHIEREDFDKLLDRVVQMENDRRDLVFPYLQRLEREIQHLHQTDVNLSRKLDALNQKFTARPEVAQLSKLTRMVARLSDSVNQIQHTEAIANLYEDISQLRQEVTYLQQQFAERNDLAQLQEIRKISPSKIARSE